MLKMVGKFLSLGLVGLVLALITVAIVKGNDRTYNIEIASEEFDEDGIGVELLRFSE